MGRFCQIDKYMHKIADNLTQVKESIQVAARAAGRNADQIRLLAASKTQPTEVLAQAYAAGQTHFGENYLQEALGKMAKLESLPLVWHFIGPLQSNKAAAVAQHFQWVHSVDRLKLAQRLSAARPPHLPPLNVCIQVNVDRQATKAGCSVEELASLAAAVAKLPNLTLRGLMAIPNPDSSRKAFADLRRLLEDTNLMVGLQLDTLSMGMSADLTEAIAEGATLVRVGTAIFGDRHL